MRGFSRAGRAEWSSWSVFDPKYGRLVGLHRVQRVPVTEKNGRRHSSEVAVVALAAQTAKRSAINRRDVRTETYRDTGPGGQHRNKTDSAVRLTHLPTGLVVTASEDRSQHKNRAVAWGRLEAAMASRREQSDHEQSNAERVAVVDGGKSDWTWTGWRDKVSGPRSSASMTRALSGRLDPLLR